MIVGDSVAGTLGLGFETVAQESNLSVWNRGRLGCGLFYGGSVLEGGEWTPVDPQCDWHQSWPEELDQFQPNVVLLLVGAWDILDRDVDGNVVKFGTVEYDKTFLQQLDAATSLLSSKGAKVVVLTTPFFSLSRAGRGDRSRVAGVQPRARRPAQLALPRLPHPEPGSLHDRRPQQVRVTRWCLRRRHRRRAGPRRRGALHPRRGGPRRQVAGASARRGAEGRRSRPVGEHRAVRPPQAAGESERQRRGRRATANSPGVVGAISSVRKKCDSSRPEPMPVFDDPSAW